MTAVLEPTAFASELRRWRGSRRWSQLELALRAGTSQRHVSFLEQGRSRPGRTLLITTLTSFATAVDVTLAELKLEAFLPADASSAETLQRADRARRKG